MSNSFRLFLAVTTIAVCWSNHVPVSRQNTRLGVSLVDIKTKLTRTSVNNDFESGSPDPWIDTSPTSVYWNVEDFSTPTEVNYPPPTPSMGTKYLRATRDSQLAPGLLILRTVTFTAFPGDAISFKFWIRSKYTGGNTLDVWLIIKTIIIFNYGTLIELTKRVPILLYCTARAGHWRCWNNFVGIVQLFHFGECRVAYSLFFLPYLDTNKLDGKPSIYRKCSQNPKRVFWFIIQRSFTVDILRLLWRKFWRCDRNWWHPLQQFHYRTRDTKFIAISKYLRGAE